MITHDIMAIGGSTGALDALKQIFADLPANFPAAVLVVRHIAPDGPDRLAEILDAAGPLPVKTAREGDLVEKGHGYVGPPGYHLLVDNGVIRLGRGPYENMVRPAIDALFRSVALCYGPRVIGVVLSGLLNDGAAGLVAVKRCGGMAVVQDPANAAAAAMPLSALTICAVDYRAPIDKMAQVLTKLANETAPPAEPAPSDIALEVRIALGPASTTDQIARIASPVALSCPACGGVLSEIHEPSCLRFRCQIGHAYTAEVLDREQAATVVEAMGVALRTLEERHTLLVKMATFAKRRGNKLSAQHWFEKAAEYRRQADIIRKTIISGKP